jgi:hypothetical protein
MESVARIEIGRKVRITNAADEEAKGHSSRVARDGNPGYSSEISSRKDPQSARRSRQEVQFGFSA